MAVLLGATAVLYLWGLGASGNANSFYAAAVQAGTKSWKAFFFGSLDSSNFITVDKPPASLWVMELSTRLFGFNSWAMLAPQALLGVGSVGLLYLSVRRWFGPTAGLLAGALLAVTPVAVLMFRFNNPDALMTFLLVLAAYATTRALDEAKLRWLLIAGSAMGFDFLTKSLQPFTVLPALALVYLLAAPTSLGKRTLHVLAAGGAVLVSAGWWVLAVALWPAADRPYIGGSQDNSVLGLAFGYNGLGRITGNESGSVSLSGGGGAGRGGGGGAMFGGATGIGRLFNAEMGTQIAWLLPAALVAFVAVIALRGRAPRTDRTRAAVLLWGGWLVVTGLTLSYASGIIHSYYTVQLAPAIAALVAIGAVVLWRARSVPSVRVALAGGTVLTGLISFQLLGRSADWNSWLRYVVLVAALGGAAVLALPPARVARLAVAGTVASLVAVAGGSTAYALNTAASPHTGSTPSAGPASAGSGFGGRGGPGGGQLPSGGFGGGGGTPPGQNGSGSAPSGMPSVGGAAGGGAMGGASNSALSALLKKATTKWAAATMGDQSAAELELASGGKAVMAIGGWDGSDPAPTLAQFKAYVAAGQIRYFIAGSNGGRGGNSDITSWVESNYTSTTVGGTTVYDLTKAKG